MKRRRNFDISDIFEPYLKRRKLTDMYSQTPVLPAHDYSTRIQTPSKFTPADEFFIPPYDNLTIPPEYTNINLYPSSRRDKEILSYIAHKHMDPAHAYLEHLSSNTPGFVLSKYSITSDGQNLKIEHFIPPYVNVRPNIAINYWRKLMLDPKVKLIFIESSTYQHANWTIIDKPRKVVEFFDPHGYSSKERDADNFVQLFIDAFQTQPGSGPLAPLNFIPRKYEVLQFRDSCPYRGFQHYESMYGGISKLNDRKGYCMMWCIFLLELRLTNKSYGTLDIQNYMLEYYGKDRTKEALGELFREFIRNFNTFMLVKVPTDYLSNSWIKGYNKKYM